ncbi:Positive alginate biosynthesis regulatory protein [Candidatus Nitrotoga sp. HW29]|uniref:LytR/AlgR family response regulator transcription factor n=1 Tax=Candidatus Nitrotoga sp. HW29 TaxID=2886963 RepID=UPI001EF23D54|nr:LytTR family DNA-binding domain-containing protein [Candidatus Nitrotoga sp. HW29]CAH1904511.1 Positive alginate biosynthesis regulatory protein [Candidatus Nitrotoga sp. HW29]
MNDVEIPLTIFIVDDEPPARNRLKDLLADCAEKMPLKLVGEAGNGHEALDKLSEMQVDVVLVDIRMPKMDGVELAQHLNKLSKSPAIIFTTAYDAHAIQAFELHAVDYLLKPIRLERLFEALVRARSAVPLVIAKLQELAPEPRKNLAIHERGKIHLLPIERVLYLRAELKYVTVRTVEREYLIEESLGALEKEFSARFIRIHRNCLVAKNEIVGFEKVVDEKSGESHWTVNLKQLNEMLPISRRQQFIVKEFN